MVNGSRRTVPVPSASVRVHDESPFNLTHSKNEDIEASSAVVGGAVIVAELGLEAVGPSIRAFSREAVAVVNAGDVLDDFEELEELDELDDDVVDESAATRMSAVSGTFSPNTAAA